MKKAVYILILSVLFPCSVFAKHLYPEKYYQKNWCEINHGTLEYTLPDGTRVDCLTEDYAVEFDFAPKWAESVGQSLYYAKKTAKKPGIVLIIESGKDFKYYYRVKTLCNDYKISLWYMKQPSNKVVEESENNIISEIINFIISFINEIINFLQSLA